MKDTGEKTGFSGSDARAKAAQAAKSARQSAREKEARHFEEERARYMAERGLYKRRMHMGFLIAIGLTLLLLLVALLLNL